MYQAKEKVFSYLLRTLKTPEGLLMFVASGGYIGAALFFEEIAPLITSVGGRIDESYRLAFVFMPLLLLVVYLRMDISANTYGARALTAFVVSVTAAAPLLKIFGLV